MQNMKNHILFAFALFLSGAIYAQPVIQIDDFSAGEEDLNIVSTASIYEKYLRLTPSQPSVAGACWLNKEKIDLTRGFETEFEFRVVEPGSKAIGDGFAFVIQNQGASFVGGTGDELGYGGLTNALVLEFDTYNNGEGSRNHIDIAYYDKSKGSFRRHATVHDIPEISDGEPHFARIHYKDGFLTLYMDSYIFPVLSSKMNIESIIGADDGRAWLGFTAATSEASAAHDLMRWSVNYYLPPPDIVEEEVEVVVSEEIPVKSRKVKIRVKDYNKIDGDIISLKFGDKWILTEHKLTAQSHEVSVTLTGFSTKLIMFANNVGRVPPNTAAITIDDGVTVKTLKMKSDLESSEAIELRYVE